MAIDKQVSRIGPYKDFIASGVRVGETLYLSGQLSIADDGSVVGAGDFAAQVRQAYGNVAAVLAEHGASMANIVDEMWLVTDIAHAVSKIGELFAVRSEAYGGVPGVTQTMVQVAALVDPAFLIEIKCVARL